MAGAPHAAVVQEVDVGIANVGFGAVESQRVRGDVLALLATDLVEVRAQIRRCPAMFGAPAAGTRSLCLAGTLGIRYRGATYNIPIETYVLPGYPARGPRLAVVPTADMLVRANHEAVSSAGVVRFDYLDAWGPESTLIELCTIAASLFSSKPPLFAKPAPALSNSQPVSESGAETPLVRENDDDDDAPPTYDSIPNTSAKVRLTTKLQERLHALFESERASIDLELAAQAALDECASRVPSGSSAKTHQDMRAAGTRTLAQTQRLEAWVRAKSDADPRDVRPRLEPADVVSRQLLVALSESAAIEDALYALDEFLYQGLIDIDVFLRDVRRLAHAQFKLKAQVKKIYALLDSDAACADHDAARSQTPAAPPLALRQHHQHR